MRDLRGCRRRLVFRASARIAGLVGCALVLGLSSASGASAAGKLLVYTGNGAVDEGYTQFAAAAERTPVTSSSFPATAAALDDYKCVVLPVTTVPFNASQTTALHDYMARGGTVVALAEHLNADSSQTIGPASVATFNALAAGYGIQALNTSVNEGPTITSNIVASTWTQGVSQVGFAATTTLTVTAPAIELVQTVQPIPTDPPPGVFLALRKVGAGKFVYSGDSNVFSDGDGGYYAGSDNAALAHDVCGDISPPTIAITTPADGGWYRANQSLSAAWVCFDLDSDVNPALTVATAAVGDPVDTTVPGATTVTKQFSVSCTDYAGNSATDVVAYKVDPSPPEVTIVTPADGAAYPRGSGVYAKWSCSDPDGLDTIDKDFTKTFGTRAVGQPIDTAIPDGPGVLKAFSVTCSDLAGNTATGTVHYTVVDTSPPVVSIASPADGARFIRGQVVAPSYSCTDPDGAGDIRACVRADFSSRPVDTSKLGTFSFTVKAVDHAGNTAEKTSSYTVAAPPPPKKVCTSRRQFRIRVKKLKGRYKGKRIKAVRATVYVNGKKATTRKGSRITAVVTLKGLKKGTYTVKINVRYSNKKTLQYKRKFRTCVPKGK